MPLKNIGPVSAQDRSLLNFTESYTLKVVRGDRRSGEALDVSRVADGAKSFRKPYDFVGTKTFGSVEAYEAYARSYIYDIKIPGCGTPGRVFVGQRNEPFAVNLGKVFDLVNLVPVDGSAFPGRHHPGPRERHHRRQERHDDRARAAAKSCLKGAGNGVIGGWTTASVRKTRTANAPVGEAGTGNACPAAGRRSRASRTRSSTRS